MNDETASEVNVEMMFGATPAEAALRDGARVFAKLIDKHAPDGKRKTSALRKVQDALGSALAAASRRR